MSHKMKLGHGFMTVYHELDPQMELPVAPIVLMYHPAVDDAAAELRVRQVGGCGDPFL